MRRVSYRQAHDEIVEIQRVAVFQGALIRFIDPRYHLLFKEIAVLRLVLAGRNELVLRPADMIAYGLRGKAFFRNLQIFHHPADQGQLIVAVIDHEVTAETQGLRFAAQDPRGQGMKGAHPLGNVPLAEHAVDPVLHLRGRLIGKRDGQDVVGINAQLFDEVGDPVGQHPGLAASRAGQYQQRPVGIGRGLYLSGIQFASEVHSPFPNGRVRGLSIRA